MGTVYVAGTVSSCSVSGIIVLTEKFGIDKLFKYLFPTYHTVPTEPWIMLSKKSDRLRHYNEAQIPLARVTCSNYVIRYLYPLEWDRGLYFASI